MRCAFFCTSDAYQIDELARFLNNEGYDPRLFGDVIYVHIGRDEETEGGDLFFFSYGCVVAWGMEPDEERQILKKIKNFETGALSTPTQDTCTFQWGDQTVINEEDDEIVLESNDVLIKLSLSHGLSQSAKLEAFEDAVGRTIEHTHHLPQEMALHGKTSLSRRRIAQKIGILFAQRNLINLHSDILDTPEFFWRRPKYEPYYQMASVYMDITKRLDILNRRLNVIHELYEILSNELHHSHSSRLELIIVFLIMIEVFLTVAKIFNWY